METPVEPFRRPHEMVARAWRNGSGDERSIINLKSIVQHHGVLLHRNDRFSVHPTPRRVQGESKTASLSLGRSSSGVPLVAVVAGKQRGCNRVVTEKKKNNDNSFVPPRRHSKVAVTWLFASFLALAAYYAEQGTCNCRAPVSLSVCSIHVPHVVAAGELLWPKSQQISIDCCTVSEPAASSSRAAARRAAANACSAISAE